MEIHSDSIALATDLGNPVISDLPSEFVHGLLEFWFGDLHNLDEIPEEKYAMWEQPCYTPDCFAHCAQTQLVLQLRQNRRSSRS
jgi:hypothetical protein